MLDANIQVVKAVISECVEGGGYKTVLIARTDSAIAHVLKLFANATDDGLIDLFGGVGFSVAIERIGGEFTLSVYDDGR